MDQPPDSLILQRAKEVLIDKGILPASAGDDYLHGDNCVKIASDGSTRRFWRLLDGNQTLCVIAAPGAISEDELAESKAAWKIGNHLKGKGVPVPRIYGWDSNYGLLLFEDLGDTRLHTVVKETAEKKGQLNGQAIQYYQAALENLILMQLKGAEGFDPAWCWDSPCYDTNLMVEKESGYFLRAFWQGLLGLEVEAGVEEELSQIAHQASQAPTEYFLHRDFQSRNIMVGDGDVRFIDFQGGRLGPLGYDVASLLIDPYCGLSLETQEQLLDFYLEILKQYIEIEESKFMKQYNLLAFQRNMQIVGAFSFLYKIRGKTFFKSFLQPALTSLQFRLEGPVFKDYPVIKSMVKRGINKNYAI